MHEQRERRADLHFKTEVDYAGSVPGAAVAIVRDGKLAFAKAYGLADVQAPARMETNNNFRLASVTKQFTAAAIEILAERGKLSYDDPLRRWLPSLPEYTGSITIRHLLTHTSGLPDYEDLIPESQTEQVHDDDIVRLLEGPQKPLFEIGSRYAYSNTGYVFLGLIAEKASGVPLGEFMRREIFEPAGMLATVVMEPGVPIANRAFGHARAEALWVRKDQSVTSATRGDGAVYSSVLDLAKWEAAIETAKVVRRETQEMAFRPWVATDAAGVGYGFGWRIGTIAGTPAMWHSGETSGFRNAFVRIPSRRIAVIVLTNRNEGNALRIAQRLAESELESKP